MGESSNEALDEFLYVATHDLREPLRGIHTYAQVLQRSATSRLTDIENNRLDTIVRLARRADSLIEGLLDYTRLGHGDLQLEQVNVNQLISQVLVVLQVSIEESSTQIRVANPLPPVRCDPLQAQRLFLNLIGNAIKFNDKDDRWVEIGHSGECYFVRDNGIGIALEDQPAIFKMFHRLHKRDAFGGGTGAGLTIVKKTVERHGGTLRLESTPGEGSTFYFTLGA